MISELTVEARMETKFLSLSYVILNNVNMIRNIKRAVRKNLLLKKILYTLAIVAVYMLGRNIILPTVPVDTAILTQLQGNDSLLNLATITGASLGEFNLFTLGLGPWMTAMILWRFLTLIKVVNGLSNKRSQKYRFLLTVVIGLLQAYSFTVGTRFHEISLFGVTGQNVSHIATLLILISGLFVTIWLGNLNSNKGIGGMMVFILINMILNFVTNISKYILENNLTSSEVRGQMLVFSLAIFTMILVNVTMYRAEYRLSIRRIGVSGEFASKSYVPIRLTPAGGMPFMYGMTLMFLPPILIGLLLNLFPNNATLIYLSQHLRLSETPGILFYMGMLYILALGFAYYNYDSYDLAENMRKNGDYIDRVRPGKETQLFLQHKIDILAQVGAIYTMVVATLPLWLVRGDDSVTSLALLISNVFIITSLMLGIIEQVQTIRLWKQYKDLI